jgi:hypothetical protein
MFRAAFGAIAGRESLRLSAPMKNIFQRGDVWYLRQAVPDKYRSVESKKVIWKSLKTDSKTVAMRKAAGIWHELIEGWEAARRGESPVERFKRANQIAEHHDLQYAHAVQVAQLPLEDILDRSEKVSLNADGTPFQREGDALLGGVPEPAMNVSKALEEFWDIAVDQFRGMTPDQVRRKKNPKIKAVNNFIEVVSDKAIANITRADMKAYRDWWNKRIDKEGLTSNSAMKDFSHFQNVIFSRLEHSSAFPAGEPSAWTLWFTASRRGV